MPWAGLSVQGAQVHASGLGVQGAQVCDTGVSILGKLVACPDLLREHIRGKKRITFGQKVPQNFGT